MSEFDDPQSPRINIDDDAQRFPLEKLTGGTSRRRAANIRSIHEQAGRIPPQATDVEQSVLGAMLIEHEAIPRAIEILLPDAFYSSKHQKVYQAIRSLFERGNPVDLITLSDELKRRGELDEVGGAYYISELTTKVASAANVEYHARIIAEKSLLRKMIETMTGFVGKAYDPSSDAFELLDQAESEIFRISDTQLRRAASSINEVLKETLERLQSIHGREGGITGIPSGFNRLDNMTGGWQPSDLAIIAARPSMGKCVAFDTEIVQADGRITTIEALYQEKEAHLLTLNADWTFSATHPSAFIDDGHKPVFRVETRLGRRVETTLSHPFLTHNGWKPLAELRVGDHIAVPRKLDVWGNQVLPDYQIKLLAYLIGDGCLTKTAPEFTNSNPRLRADFCDAAIRFPGVDTYTYTSEGTGTPTVRIRSACSDIIERRQTFARRLTQAMYRKQLSASTLADQLSVSKGAIQFWQQGAVAPKRQRFEALCEALDVTPEHLAPDGHATISRSSPHTMTQWLQTMGLWGKSDDNKTIPDVIFTLPKPQLALFLNRLFATDGWATVLTSTQVQIGYASVSERLCQQLQHLLLRFGIIARLEKRRIRYKKRYRNAWQLDITDSHSLYTFIEEIGIESKEEALAHAKAQLAKALPDASLTQPATSEVYWDEIVAIEPQGMKQVYDLTIPGTHNFVANDICVHNTAFCLACARNAALHPQYPTGVAIFSLEMSAQQLAQRLLTSEARLDAQSARTGRLRDEDWPRLARAAGSLSSAPIYIDDTPGLSILELRAKCRRLKAEHEIGLVIVDYLQLMHGSTGGRNSNREQEIAQISRSLKSLAKELDVPVIALSQLSRAVETRGGDKRPQLSDLRESGSIEQDADVVMFIYRAERYGITVDENGNSTEGMAELIIGKQRNGPIGNVPLAFVHQYARFENLTTYYGPGPEVGGGEFDEPPGEAPF